MGTNFYYAEEKEHCPNCNHVIKANRGDHIGKRSGAGFYCWDCDTTLCYGGIAKVHKGYNDWHEKCPKCGAKPIEEGWNGAAGVELGFYKPKTETTGVRSACSFSWAQEPATVKSYCENHMDEKIIIDEYGKEYTGAEFLTMLRCNCPIEFIHSIGVDFS